MTPDHDLVSEWKSVHRDSKWFNCVQCGEKVILGDWKEKIQWYLRKYHRCITCLEPFVNVERIRRN